uniref:Condensin-2 complex subunit D3 n=1 Tax=Astyanax mexicanus TaxID=7994 RepID=A0A3B1JDT2_ASTMX
MALMRVVELLRLSAVSTVWVDTIWDLEFTDIEPLDSRIEDEIKEDPEVFKKLYKQLLPFSSDDDSAQNIWTVLGENEVSVKSLVAVLAYFILGGKAKSPSVEQRHYSLQASSLYLLLLRIPGSVANKVFHQILFDTCLDVILRCWPQTCGKKRKKTALKSSQGDPKTGKRSKSQKKASEEMEIDEDDEEEEEEEVYFSAQDLLKLREDVVALLQTLLRLLEKFSLKGKPQSVDSCLRIFTELTTFEPVVGELSFTEKRDVDQLERLPELAYHGLWLLCSPTHGEGNECRRRVFHRLLYVILMMRKDERSNPCLLAPSQTVYKARDQAILFICNIVDEQPEATLPLLKILLQHICHQMVEKSDYRASGSQAVGKLMAKMPCEEYATFIRWLHNYSQNNRVAFRMFALDVTVVLLGVDEREADESLITDLAVYLSHRFLVHNIIYARCSDISPTVRGHALHCLAQCLELPSRNATKWIHEIFSSSSTAGTQTLMETAHSEKTLKRRDTAQKTAMTFRTIELSKHKSIAAASHHGGTGSGIIPDNTSVEYQETMALFKQRIGDPKPNVRKCALETVMSLLKHGVILCSPENLAILSERCRDPAVSVKKKSMQCLMDLLTALHDNIEVQEAWLRGVVPTVIDSESTVQEKALECLDDVILKHIKSHGSYKNHDTSQKLAWDLLGLMCDKCQDLGRYFSKAFSVWSRQQKFTTTFVNNLIWHTEGDRAAEAWLLLAKVAGGSSKLNYGTVLEAWEHTVRSPVVDVKTTCHILTVISNLAAGINDDTKSRIVADLMGWLKGFNLPLEVISSSVDALVCLGQSENVTDTMAFLNQYCGELVSLCEEYLSGILLNERGAENLNEELLVKYVYTLGVASLHCPAKVKKRVFLLIQSILTSSEQSEEGAELPASQPLSQFKSSSMPTVVRAHAVITLGKLCLQHEELMVKYLPAFARELEVGKELAVRNNVVVVLCDLCVRYPNTLTRYIPNISACLRDPEPLIRKQTLIMLSNLLQEEFIKWKGSLFFRFTVALVDPEPTISDLCEYCLVDLFLKKNQLMFSQHFIECIFHFNSYEKHKKYNKFSQTDSEKIKFSLKGMKNQGKRFRIYRFLLKNFTDEQRFNITTRISQDVLALFVDSELPLDADGAELLADVFDVLSLKEIKLTAISGSAHADEPPEDEMLVSQVQKKNFVENVIPMVIALKNQLEEHRSPVLKHLMAYLQVTMQDYRSEVKELFVADEQLAAEVEYNLKMYEKQKQQEQQEQLEQQLTNFTLALSLSLSLRRRTFAAMLTPVGRRVSQDTISSAPAPRQWNVESPIVRKSRGRKRQL